MTADVLRTVDELLRSPRKVADRSRTGENLRELVVASFASLAVGAGVFGAVLASARGGWQLFYSAVKLPLAMTATLLLVVPALYAIGRCFGRPLSFAGVVGLALAATARGALVLSALAPVVWLSIDGGTGYHATVVLAAGAYAIAGLTALSLLLGGIGSDVRGLAVIAAFGLVLMPTAGQTAWMLRPFIGRPAQPSVPFLRHRESSFLDAVSQSARSSVGIYRAVERADSELRCASRSGDCAEDARDPL